MLGRLLRRDPASMRQVLMDRIETRQWDNEVKRGGQDVGDTKTTEAQRLRIDQER